MSLSDGPSSDIILDVWELTWECSLFLIASSCSMFTGQLWSSRISENHRPVSAHTIRPYLPHRHLTSIDCSPITAAHGWISRGARSCVCSVNNQTPRVCLRGEIDAYFSENISVPLHVFPDCLLLTLPDQVFWILGTEVLYGSKGNGL